MYSECLRCFLPPFRLSRFTLYVFSQTLVLQASVTGVFMLYSVIRLSQYWRCGFVLVFVSKGMASWFFSRMYADIPVFCIISSIGIKSIIISILAWGVFLVIVVVDLAANLSNCCAVFIEFPHVMHAYNSLYRPIWIAWVWEHACL